MNERIKELWEESTLSLWPRPGKFTAGEYDYNLKAFAELIVQECGVALSPMLRDMVSRGQAYDLIKQHFGVTK